MQFKMLKTILIGIVTLLAAIILLSVTNKKFYQVEAATLINSSKENVWKILAVDFGNIYRYTENVERSKYLGHQTEGIGTQRLCELKGGGFMKEEITG